MLRFLLVTLLVAAATYPGPLIRLPESRRTRDVGAVNAPLGLAVALPLALIRPLPHAFMSAWKPRENIRVAAQAVADVPSLDHGAVCSPHRSLA